MVCKIIGLFRVVQQETWAIEDS